MKRVLVTGASGFVGRHLVGTLLERTSVVAAVRDRSRVPPSLHAVESISFELESTDPIEPEQLEQFDCIYHLAAHVHVMRPQAYDEQRFERLNVRATEALARSAAAAGVRRFVYVSSIKVNGERTIGRKFSPHDVPAPEDAYGRSKLAAENALFKVAAESALEVVIVRPPLVYGPGVGANFRRLMSLVSAGWPLPFGSIENRRSLISVWNLTNLLGEMLDKQEAAGRVWLASDDQDVSTPQLLRMLGTGLGKREVSLLPIPVGLLRAAARLVGRSAEMARLTESLQVDMSETTEELNWRPQLSLEKGLERTAKWFLEAHCVGH